MILDSLFQVIHEGTLLEQLFSEARDSMITLTQCLPESILAIIQLLNLSPHTDYGPDTFGKLPLRFELCVCFNMFCRFSNFYLRSLLAVSSLCVTYSISVLILSSSERWWIFLSVLLRS